MDKANQRTGEVVKECARCGRTDRELRPTYSGKYNKECEFMGGLMCARCNGTFGISLNTEWKKWPKLWKGAYDGTEHDAFIEACCLVQMHLSHADNALKKFDKDRRKIGDAR
jgi:hypothetical protein